MARGCRGGASSAARWGLSRKRLQQDSKATPVTDRASVFLAAPAREGFRECNSLCVHTCPAMFQLPVLRPRHRGRLHHQPWLDPVTGMRGDPGAPSSRYHSSYHGNQQVLLKVQKTTQGWGGGWAPGRPALGGEGPRLREKLSPLPPAAANLKPQN